AQWYERVHTDDLSPYYALLAHHWGSARVNPKTIHYLEKAGDQALENDANEEARKFFSEAVRLADRAPTPHDDRAEPFTVESDRRASWDVRLGDAHQRMGMLAESEHHFRHALSRLDHRVPDSTRELLGGVAAETVRQARERLRPHRTARTSAATTAVSRMV